MGFYMHSLRFHEDFTFFSQVPVEHQFAMPQVVQHWPKVRWVSVNEIGTSFILKESRKGRSNNQRNAKSHFAATKKEVSRKVLHKVLWSSSDYSQTPDSKKENLSRLKCFYKGQFEPTPSVVIREAFNIVKKRAGERQPPLIQRCRWCWETGSSRSVQTQNAVRPVRNKSIGI